MKTILVPTDFSPSAENAALYAADMALAINATVLLLHVYQTPVIYSEVPVVVDDTEVIHSYERSLTELKTNLRKKTSSKVKIETEIRSGIFFNELKAVCAYRKPYTVIM